MINGKYPVVFIHFSNRTLMCISNGTDGLPVEYAQEFSKALSDFGWKNDIIEGEKTKARKVSFWAKLKYKVSLTRRINRFINLNYN